MLGLFLTVSVLAQSPLYQDPSADQLIRRTMEATYNLELTEARAAARTLQNRYPNHPAGFTLAAETYWWEAQMDPGNNAIEDSYYQAQKLAVEKGESALRINQYPRIEILAYLASAHGSHARFQVTQKEAYFSAMMAGRRAHGYAEQVFEADKSYYDIWVGIGAYNYFTGSLPAVIKPFAFLLGARGDKNLGFQQLRTAIEKARYSNTEAQIIYYTALLEDKQYAAAFEVLEKLRSAHPKNFVLYTWATDWFRRQGRNLEGAAYFEKQFESQSSTSPLMAKYALFEKAQLLAAQRQTAEAIRTLDRLRTITPADRLLDKKVAAFRRALG
jgi:hypothetical protein